MLLTQSYQSNSQDGYVCSLCGTLLARWVVSYHSVVMYILLSTIQYWLV